MRKIIIPKLILENLYINQNLTTLDIAKIYNIDRTTVSKKLKGYNIPINYSQRKFEKIKKQSLNQQQKELIVGSVLGDASLICSQRRINTYFKVSHCEKQLEYLIWKKNILGKYAYSDISKHIDKRGNSIMYSFTTLSHKDLNYFYENFYHKGRKIISENVLNKYLSPFSLAVWLMDDGSLSNSSYRISTDCFLCDENYLLKYIFQNKFQLYCNVLKYERKGKDYYYLSFDRKNSSKLRDIIIDYIDIKCMKYKII